MRTDRLRAPALTIALGLVAALGTAVPGGADAAEGRRVDQSWGVPGSAWITIQGRGYGHGHGMSQHGAEGAARQGPVGRAYRALLLPGDPAG